MYSYEAQVAADLRATRWVLIYNAGLFVTTGASMVGLGALTEWSPLWGLLLLLGAASFRVEVGAPPRAHGSGKDPT